MSIHIIHSSFKLGPITFNTMALFQKYHSTAKTIHMSHLVGKPTWFPNRSDTNRAVQAQKRARSLKFRIIVEEELYYPSSENKGADQLRSYCESDLRLCFRLSRLLVFPWGGSYIMYGKTNLNWYLSEMSII